MALCSRYLYSVETTFNWVKRNYDGVPMRKRYPSFLMEECLKEHLKCAILMVVGGRKHNYLKFFLASF